MKVIFSLILIIIIISIGVLVLKEVGDEFKLKVMYQRCCNGSVCSDTYLDTKTNECVLVISGQRYKAENLSAEWIKNNTLVAI